VSHPYDAGFDDGARSVQVELDRVRNERNELARLINDLAATVDDLSFSRPLAWICAQVVQAWLEKNRILAAGVE